MIEVAIEIGIKIFSSEFRTDNLTTVKGIINLEADYRNEPNFVAFNTSFGRFTVEHQHLKEIK